LNFGSHAIARERLAGKKNAAPFAQGGKTLLTYKRFLLI